MKLHGKNGTKQTDQLVHNLLLIIVQSGDNGICSLCVDDISIAKRIYFVHDIDLAARDKVETAIVNSRLIRSSISKIYPEISEWRCELETLYYERTLY